MSTFSKLSSGEFVGVVAGNFDQIIGLKTFHAQIRTNHENNNREKEGYLSFPSIRSADLKDITVIYQIIKQDVQDNMEEVMQEVLNDPARHQLVVKKG